MCHGEKDLGFPVGGRITDYKKRGVEASMNGLSGNKPGANGGNKRGVMTEDERWMAAALVLAQRGAEAGEVPVGAILVSSGQQVAEAYNSPIQLHDATAHAEILVLRRGGDRLQNYRLSGGTLYVTLEPCAMCAAALVHARIARLVFGAPDPRVGAAGSAFDLAREPRFNHQITVVGGVLAAECERVLREFFRARR